MSEATTTPPIGHTVTLRLPKINLQVLALVLIAAVAGLQSFQLFRLSQGGVSVKPVSAASSSVTPSASASSHDSSAAGSGDLKSMVGGC